MDNLLKKKNFNLCHLKRNWVRGVINDSTERNFARTFYNPGYIQLHYSLTKPIFYSNSSSLTYSSVTTYGS